MRDLQKMIEIVDMEEKDPFRLNNEIYSFSIDYYGTVTESEHETDWLGSLNFIVNGKTGEVNRYPVFDSGDNENHITSEEWECYLSMYDFLGKFAEHKYTKIATMLFDLNTREDFSIEDSEYDENEYIKELIMYSDQFKIRYLYSKINKNDFLVMDFDEYGASLTKQSCKFYDTLQYFVKQHVNLSSHFI